MELVGWLVSYTAFIPKADNKRSVTTLRSGHMHSHGVLYDYLTHQSSSVPTPRLSNRILLTKFVFSPCS